MRKKLLLILLITLFAVLLFAGCSKRYELTLTATAGGAVSGEGMFRKGDTVTVIATPNNGFGFTAWEKGGEVVSNDAVYTFEMPDNDLKLTARFTDTTEYAVTVNVVGQGTVTGDRSYLENETVALTATAANGYFFIGWYEGGELIESENTYTFVMQKKTVTLTARFAKTSTLTVIVEGEGVVSGNNGTYLKGQTVSLTAAASQGYYFIGWYAGGALKEDAAVYEFTMPSYDVTVTAEFVEYRQWTLSFESATYGYITDGDDNDITDGDYFIGDLITVVAVADEDYAFYGWYFNDEFVSNEIRFTFKMPNYDVSVKSVFVLDGFDGGDGTEDNPYLISDANNLIALATLVNNAKGSHTAGRYFEMAADIKLNAEWTPIGYMLINNNYTRSFQGRFDGKEYEISGLMVTGQNHASTLNNQLYAGLFGYIYNAEVKNIVLSGVSFDIEYTVTAVVNAGAVAAYGVSSTVSGCKVEGAIVVQSQRNALAGGIVGYNRQSTVTRCTFDGSINATGNLSSGGTNTMVDAGGIAAFNDTSTISRCETSGVVVANSKGGSGTISANAGGIAGRNVYVVELCYSNMDAEAIGTIYAYAGGISAQSNSANGKIISCGASGNVSVGAVQFSYAGGLSGLNNGASVEKCYAEGLVSAASPTRDAYAGGLIGSTNSTVKNSYATGDVEAVGGNQYSYAGGLIGTSSNAVTNCYAAGSTYAEAPNTACSAGLIAFNEGTVTNCFAFGDSGAHANIDVSVGGLLGYNDGTAVGCFRYLGQKFELKISQAVTYEANNMDGTEVNLNILNSIDFYFVSLEWDADIWDYKTVNFGEGVYPTLIMEI